MEKIWRGPGRYGKVYRQKSPIIVGSAPRSSPHGPRGGIFASMSPQEPEFARTLASGSGGQTGNGPAQKPASEGLKALPPYARSLLRISVPLTVTLASPQLPLKRILQLGPGSIIPLEKSCEEPLTLQVGSHSLAVGEAVKVGDKFGLRINSMVMPEEKFWAIRGKREGKEEHPA